MDVPHVILADSDLLEMVLFVVVVAISVAGSLIAKLKSNSAEGQTGSSRDRKPGVPQPKRVARPMPAGKQQTEPRGALQAQPVRRPTAGRAQPAAPPPSWAELQKSRQPTPRPQPPQPIRRETVVRSEQTEEPVWAELIESAVAAEEAARPRRRARAPRPPAEEVRRAAQSEAIERKAPSAPSAYIKIVGPLTRAELRRAIVLNELLGPPVAMRREPLSSWA